MAKAQMRPETTVKTRTTHGYNRALKIMVAHTLRLRKNKKKKYFTNNKENNIHPCIYVSTTFWQVNITDSVIHGWPRAWIVIVRDFYLTFFA